MMDKNSESGQGITQLIAHTLPLSQVAEQFRTLRTNINFLSPQQEIRSIVITSAQMEEGKSTSAVNLSIVFAQDHKKVLLIDGDLRKPVLHQVFKLNNDSGLSAVLGQGDNLKDAIKKTVIQGLDLLTAGPLPHNPAELLGSKLMVRLMDELLADYDLLIIDSPPLLSVADSQILANKCEGTLLVINAGATKIDSAIQAKEAIASSNGRLLGAVLNNFANQKSNEGYPYGKTEAREAEAQAATNGFNPKRSFLEKMKTNKFGRSL